ncbi:hypothetical protein [Helicobacter sp. T3_23-1056]
MSEVSDFLLLQNVKIYKTRIVGSYCLCHCKRKQIKQAKKIKRSFLEKSLDFVASYFYDLVYGLPRCVIVACNDRFFPYFVEVLRVGRF